MEKNGKFEMEQLSETQRMIADVCNEIRDFLIEKNKSYGNSAIEPVRVFSKASPLEQINVRMDDKLSRISRGNEYGDDDTEKDLVGYLILKRVCKKLELKKQP